MRSCILFLLLYTRTSDSTFMSLSIYLLYIYIYIYKHITTQNNAVKYVISTIHVYHSIYTVYAEQYVHVYYAIAQSKHARNSRKNAHAITFSIISRGERASNFYTCARHSYADSDVHLCRALLRRCF